MSHQKFENKSNNEIKLCIKYRLKKIGLTARK